MRVLDIDDEEIELRDMDDDDDLITIDALEKFAQQRQSAQDLEQQAKEQEQAEKEQVLDAIQAVEDRQDTDGVVD